MIDLKSVVEKYPECLDSSSKFKSYMMDLYPDNSNKAHIRILADIVDCGIALEIKNGKTDSISISIFCNTMENQYGYSTKLVEECVNQFLVAFGFSTNDTVTNTKPKKNNGVRKSSKKHTNTSADKLPSKEKNVKYVCNLSDFIILSNGWLEKYNGHDECVMVPNSVKRIGTGAFADCYNLTSITFSDGVSYIGRGAFANCHSLTSVTFSDNITISDNTTIIDKEAFSGCLKLSSISIPNGFTSIGEKAFTSCHSLTSIIIPESVVSIGRQAFSNCVRLTSIAIPDCVTTIYSDILNNTAFYNSFSNRDKGVVYACNHLITAEGYYPRDDVDYKIKSGTKTIAHGAFSSCGLMRSATIPDGVTSIGEMAFATSNLEKVTIPDSVTNIGKEAFAGCRKLKNVAIPKSVTAIGEAAFRFCVALKSITIPNSVVSIGKEAFAHCDSLTVYFCGKEQKNKFADCFGPNVKLIVKSE